MKQLSLTVLSLLFLAPFAHGQMISSTYNDGSTTDPYVYDANSFPYFVQFGVTGTSAGPLLLNVGGSGFSGVSVTPVTEFGDVLAEQTQFTSGAHISYSDGTSPTSSSTTVTNEILNTGAAGDISVQTGYSGNAATVQASGQGLTFTLTFTQAFSVASLSFLLNTYDATAQTTYTLTDGLAGTHTVVLDDPHVPPNGQNDNYIQSIELTNIAAGDTLNISDLETGTEGTPYSNVSVTGFVITDVTLPEPSSYALMFGGVAFLLGIMRLRRLSA